ncbi:ABC transporter ATP-binding protein [Miniphocaeibacter massiliensis]|uniref:ABC transporter ATP-binding protein n=1 Tax=Miniphocaeibacter massiliensis TaxID=2041841 RepID=UPI000C1C6F25|nr:ABC transporter ATP-binding protein [Miniphocaeibacter massiliensis]
MKSENTNKENILTVENLTVSFHTYAGEVKAVRDISFYLKPKETLALVGESGCGKTVTSKAILRLLKVPPTEIKDCSKILFEDEEVLKMSKKRLFDYRGKEVSMIFQDPMTSLNPTMTIGNQIMEGILIHTKATKKEAEKKAIELLKKVNIPNPEERMKQYPHELSGGMRQRVMIAISLACEPKILIADEPTTALDVTIQAQILDLLQELKEEFNTAIILVTHDLGVVANVADRIQVMYAGKVVETGKTKDIFSEPKHPYTFALLKSVPRLDTDSDTELYSLGGTPPDLIRELKGCIFAERCPYTMEICKEQEPELTQISPEHTASCWLLHKDAPKLDEWERNA